MAFNVSNFVRDTSKSAVQKITDKVAGQVSAGLPSGALGIASSTAQALLKGGSALSNVANLTSNKTDAIVSGALSEFFALAGQNPSRAVGGALSALRQAGNESIQNYLQNINPSTKIAEKKSNDSLTILSVI